MHNEWVQVVAYRRVSTAEQGGSGLGLKAQQDQIRDYVERKGWQLRHDFEEVSSGGSQKRPVLAQALWVLDTAEAEALVVAKLDRLSRSLLHFVNLLEYSRKGKWSLIALDLGIDTSTPSGEMVANVLMSFAQFERRLIGQRTKDALAVKKAQGTRLGRPRMISAELAEMITGLRDQGRTLGDIANILNEDGVPTVHGGREWHRSTVRAILGAYEMAPIAEGGGN